MLKQSLTRSLLHTTVPPSPITRLPIQRTFRLPRRDYGILTLNPGRKSFTLLFNGDRLPSQADVPQTVIVSSFDEVAHFLLLLGETCEIYISPEYRQANPHVYAEVRTLSYPVNSKDASFDIETAAGLMKKLPLDFKNLINSPLAVTLDDQIPGPIDKKYVHKKNDSNVLISEVLASGRMLYFNMFNETDELTFDHTSDHVQGMLLLEALRQTAIATAHIQGLSFDGGLALLNYNTNFFHYLESSD